MINKINDSELKKKLAQNIKPSKKHTFTIWGKYIIASLIL